MRIAMLSFIVCLTPLMISCTEDIPEPINDQFVAENLRLKEEIWSLERELSGLLAAPSRVQLIEGTLIVNSRCGYHCPFCVDADMENARLEGTFESVAGFEVSLVIVDNAYFERAEGDPLELRMVVRSGRIDLAIEEPGTYHILFLSTIPELDVAVKANVDLVFDRG